MHQLTLSVAVAVLAGLPVFATLAEADADSSAAARDGARVAEPPASEAGARSRDAQSGEAYLLRRGTEVTMLWSLLTKKPFSDEEIACDYLVERNFERARPLMLDSDYSCGSMDEFTRRDRVAAIVPQIGAEYAALAKAKEFRFWLTVPMKEYDFKRGGYPTGLADKAEVPLDFPHAVEDARLLLENAGRLAFVRLDEPRARALASTPFWLFELTIRPTGFKEKPFTRASTLKYIKAKIVRARLFTTEGGGGFSSSLQSVKSGAKVHGDSPLLELAFESAR